ncbi:MAG: cell wall-binding repeat-containing protein [Peptostreptococcus anaerobius]|uniref:cell wall-binding repeat-containing protein n=1 Tax=Peptostreptococcus anaerobius TaxID=1261 RepID=UPI000335F5B0|nr:cell wall-binding repeat-containing protein [Peptostreptococcus anaerobius]MDU5096086.1 cell wall-binding repeat-containing protein [Peptostreptococcus anaerobius]CCY48413.1 putative amidase domain protein [Peptostreptococcus anaerobius CAG:621]
MKLRKYVTKALALSLILSSIAPSFADTKIDNIKVLAGKNRVETSLLTAKEVKNTDTIVVASAYAFPDALSSYNLVAKKKAKLVLIKNENDLKDQLDGIKRAYIVGGQSAINQSVENFLINSGITTSRLAGSNRYITNKETLRESGLTKVGVADGRNYPDALSASGLLAKEGLGLMLVDGAKSYRPGSYDIRYTFGGYNSVAQSGGTRLAGKTRYETSQAINRDKKFDKYVVTAGSNYADALASINLVSDNRGILLTKPGDYAIDGKSTSEFIKNAKHVYVVGGLVKSTTIEQIKDLLNTPADKKPDQKPVKPNDNKPKPNENPVNPKPNKPDERPVKPNERPDEKPDQNKPKPDKKPNKPDNNPSKPDEKPNKPVNPNQDKPKPDEGRWVKNEKIERKLIKPAWEEVIYTTRPKMENHIFTSDGSLDVTMKLVEWNVYQYREDDKYLYGISDAVINLYKDIYNNILIYDKISDTDVKLIADKINAFDKWPKEIRSRLIQSTINTLNINNKIVEKSNDPNKKLLNLSKEEVEDNRRHMGLITDNEFKHYLNKDLSTPEGTNDLIWKEVANGTERIRTSTIVHSDLYQNYKISWEQNSKTGEKRNETKIKWGQPYED